MTPPGPKLISAMAAAVATLVTASIPACEWFSDNYVIVPIHHYGLMDDVPEDVR